MTAGGGIEARATREGEFCPAPFVPPTQLATVPLSGPMPRKVPSSDTRAASVPTACVRMLAPDRTPLSARDRSSGGGRDADAARR